MKFDAVDSTGGTVPWPLVSDSYRVHQRITHTKVPAHWVSPTPSGMFTPTAYLRTTHHHDHEWVVTPQGILDPPLQPRSNSRKLLSSSS